MTAQVHPEVAMQRTEQKVPPKRFGLGPALYDTADGQKLQQQQQRQGLRQQQQQCQQQQGEGPPTCPGPIEPQSNI
jgi:hypothetical protein